MSNTNDDMKYVGNNLYGYGYLEEQYLSPTKNLNDIEVDINEIKDVNEAQSLDIEELRNEISQLILSSLTKDEADMLYGTELSFDKDSSELSLINGDGEVLNTVVLDIKSGVGIRSIELTHEDDHGNVGIFLKFVYDTVDEHGEVYTETTYVDISELSDIYVAGNGIDIDSDGKVSVKFAEGESGLITATEDGITYTGLTEAIETVNDRLDTVEGKVEELEAKTGAMIAGEELEVNNVGEMAIGNYNSSTKNETLFSVGNGGANERKNAFEVKADGTVWMMVENEYMCINDLLSQIAHEIY